MICITNRYKSIEVSSLTSRCSMWKQNHTAATRTQSWYMYIFFSKPCKYKLVVVSCPQVKLIFFIFSAAAFVIKNIVPCIFRICFFNFFYYIFAYFITILAYWRTNNTHNILWFAFKLTFHLFNCFIADKTYCSTPARMWWTNCLFYRVSEKSGTQSA